MDIARPDLARKRKLSRAAVQEYDTRFRGMSPASIRRWRMGR